jgi:aerobic C4-dicarboxylate transport protein
MLTILKSYSSLELTAFQIFWVIGISILVSFILFSQSYMGIYTALITACTLYGRGLQDGYVLILPVLPFLLLIAGLLDASNTAYLTLLFNDDREFRIPEDPEDFI